LVEAHGTGTVVGDRTELGTLTDVYLEAGATRGSAALGSVKSQIGHTKCAAGLAGLIKAALALHHRALPPTLLIRKPNAAWDPATSPFSFSDHTRPWPAEPRHASVSAFGFGGANFHAVLAAYEGADPPVSGLERWPAELFLFRASDRSAALARMEQVERLLTDEALESPSSAAREPSRSPMSRAASRRVAGAAMDRCRSPSSRGASAICATSSGARARSRPSRGASSSRAITSRGRWPFSSRGKAASGRGCWRISSSPSLPCSAT
jgi:acyl transferase domain-containing protein